MPNTTYRSCSAASAATASVDGPGTGSALARCLAHGPPTSAHAEHEPGPWSAPSGNTTKSAPWDAASTMLALILASVAAVSPQIRVKFTQATVTTDSVPRSLSTIRIPLFDPTADSNGTAIA